jgi:hypothetical protein
MEKFIWSKRIFGWFIQRTESGYFKIFRYKNGFDVIRICKIKLWKDCRGKI